MAVDVFTWVDATAGRRTRAGLGRTFQVREVDEQTIDLASNDYLGLSGDARVVEGGLRALRAWGSGATGARLATGTTRLHRDLEEALSAFCGMDSAIVFSSGYMANMGALTGLCRSGTLIVADQHNHASIHDGCALSGARVVWFPHRDLEHLEDALATRTEQRALVVTESVFSMDGDLAPLEDILALCRRYSAGLFVDDAHGLGVLAGGRGCCVATGLTGEPDVVVMVTLSKALASQGGVIMRPARV